MEQQTGSTQSSVNHKHQILKPKKKHGIKCDNTSELDGESIPLASGERETEFEWENR